MAVLRTSDRSHENGRCPCIKRELSLAATGDKGKDRGYIHPAHSAFAVEKRLPFSVGPDV